MQSVIVPLNDTLGTPLAGGKAAALAALHAAGLPIPASIVIPAEVPGRTLPSVAVQILTWAAGLTPPGLIARSSAPVEDGDIASFAGLFTSRFASLNPEQVCAALRAVRASAACPAATAYARTHCLEPVTEMPVLVQPALRPYAAGVLAAEIHDSHCARWRIEAVHGLAEPLVSGTATGEAHAGSSSDPGPAGPAPARQRFVVLPGTEAELRTLPGEYAAVPHRYLGPAHAKIAFSAGGLLRLYRPPSWATGPVLGSEDCTELLRLAGRASAVLGLDRIDLEWALLPTGEFFVLQARPLTAPLPGTHAPGQAASSTGWHGIRPRPALPPAAQRTWRTPASHLARS